MILTLGEYLPDIPPLGNPGLIKATNSLPYANSYRPFPGLVQNSTNALNGVAIGFISTRDKSGNSYTYAGDQSALYRLASSAWYDATRSSGAYTTASDDVWEFAKWGERVIAVNFNDAVQEITMGSSNFVALAGSPPKARHMGVVRDFLVLGNVTDYSSGAAVPNRVHWSGFDNVETWTPDVATQADYQDLQGDGGWVQKVIGGEYGLIFQERSIWRMTYIGSPIVFQFDEIEPGRGTPSPGSVVKQGARVFYLGQDDFYMFYGGQSLPIGHDRVYRSFLDDFDANYYHKIFAGFDPAKPIVMWAYPGVGNTAGRPNKLLIYNWSVNKWSHAELDIEMLCNLQSAGYTLDELDSISSSVDALAYSLDSRVWMGKTLNLAAFDSIHQLNTFEGSDLTATFEWGERQLYPSVKALVTNTVPLVESASGITVQSGTKNLRHETANYGTAISMNKDGECPMLREGRYHSFRLKISNGFSEASGLDVFASKGGRY